MIREWCVARMWKEAVLSLHLYWGTEENHGNLTIVGLQVEICAGTSLHELLSVEHK
jgi:hypothetical protein